MSVLTKLSDKAYWAMRKAMVKEVYKSETLTISDVAIKHKISPSTLWKWCQEDLGPTQINKLTSKSHAIRGKRITAKSKPVVTAAALKKDMKIILAQPRPVTAADIMAIKAKNKPWDKKKARIKAEQAIAIPACMAALGISEETPSIRSIVHAPTVNPQLAGVPIKVLEQVLHGNRKQCGATVIINLDEQGKFIKYEVTGDASVQVFTRNK